MLNTAISTLLTLPFIALNAYSANIEGNEPKVLSSHTISLENRYAAESVNDVFKDNILLNLAYMNDKVKDPTNIDWAKIRQPFAYQFSLKPNQTFAYHDSVSPEYQDKFVKSTNAHFNAQEGFKSDGYLYGDGVCHLASLIYWAAKDAKLNSVAPANHDFANIPDIPREYGVAIYNQIGQLNSNALQNLYITNNRAQTIDFKFDYDGKDLTVSVVQKD